MSTITFAGNLAADPELRHTRTGKSVVRFTVIENRRCRTADGWTDAEPNVFRVEAWGQLAENIVASLHTGDRAHIEGRIDTGAWEDSETGAKRTAQHVTADEVSFSLRFHAVVATKNTADHAAQDEAPIPSWDVAQIPGDDNPF